MHISHAVLYILVLYLILRVSYLEARTKKHDQYLTDAANAIIIIQDKLLEEQ